MSLICKGASGGFRFNLFLYFCILVRASAHALSWEQASHVIERNSDWAPV